MRLKEESMTLRPRARGTSYDKGDFEVRHLEEGKQFPKGVGSSRRDLGPQGAMGFLRRESEPQQASRGGNQNLENNYGSSDSSMRRGGLRGRELAPL